MPKRNRTRLAIVSAALFVAALLITLTLMLFVAEPRAERVLYFPGTVTRELSGESRTVPRYSSPERNIRTVVEEVILGPTSIYSSPALSQRTDIELFMFRDNTVYLDLSAALIFNAGDINLDVKESLDALKKNILFNFPHVRDIVVTVSGQLPFEPLYVDISEDQI